MKAALITVLRKAEAASEPKWKNNSERLVKTNMGIGECGDYAMHLLFLILNKIPMWTRMCKIYFFSMDKANF